MMPLDGIKVIDFTGALSGLTVACF